MDKEEKLTDSVDHNLLGDDTDNEPWEPQDSLGGKPMDQVINKDTTEKMTTVSYKGGNTKSDDLDSESPVQSSGSESEKVKNDKESVQVTQDQTSHIKETDNKEDIHDKYLELVAHNTRLVDILRTTLELQADIFRRITRYLFP